MSLTIPQRAGAPVAPTSSPLPTAAEPTSAPPARRDTGLGTFKDGYEQSLNGADNRANNKANNRADNKANSTFDVDPGKAAELVRNSRAARQSGGIRIEGNVRDAINGFDPAPIGGKDHFGGSNYRRNSRGVE